MLKFLNGGTPSTAHPDYWNGTIPWITGADAEQRVTLTARKHVSEKGVRESSTNIVPKGNILLVTRTGVGKVSIAGVDVAISQDLTGVIPNRELVDANYLQRQLFRLGPALRRQAQGTIIQGIERQQVESLRVPLPLVPEQRRIAAVLDTMDEAITRSEAVIAKFKQVRVGLLHDLLTCGVDENGELRDPVAHAERFKETLFGALPCTWDISSLDDACEVLRDGTHLPPKRVENGPLLLSVQNMSDGILVQTNADTRVSWEFYRTMHRSWEIREGDVCLAIVGATLGKTAVVPRLPPFTVQRSLAVLRGRERRLRNPFLYLYLSSPPLQRLLWQNANQTAQPGLYLASLGKVAIPIPHVDEQDAIADCARAIQSHIDTEMQNLSKLTGIRAGLTDDLLTGRIKVLESLSAMGAQA